MANNLVTKAVELIYQMEGTQLQEVIEAVQLKRQYLAKQAIKKFVIGDMVQFTSKRTGGKVNATCSLRCELNHIAYYEFFDCLFG